MARGDHLSASRGLYRHHGIDCGDGTVVHFDGGPFGVGSGIVRRTSFAEFMGDGSVVLERHESSFDPNDVVRRALSRLGESGYDVLFNNCEHFATWCKTGRARSAQVRRVGTALAVVAFAMFAHIPIGARFGGRSV